MEHHQYVVVDVFTDTPLEGNPTAIFLDAQRLPTNTMQRIAAEMHLSETVFVLPASMDGDVRVRIFTPVNELPFAGHPTLGAAIALGESMSGTSLRMETGKGTIPFTLNRDSTGRVITASMRQPIPTWEPYDKANTLLKGLGLTQSELPVEIYDNGPRHALVGLPSIEALSAVDPDHRALAGLSNMAANCFANAGDHWRLRMFSPAYGVVEDAATGSAAGSLAVHLARHGLIRFGEQIRILQGVEIGRPSLMRSTVTGNLDRTETVEVEGGAVVVARGTLTA